MTSEQEAVFTSRAKELAEIIGTANGNPDEGWGIWRDWLYSFARRLEIASELQANPKQGS